MKSRIVILAAILAPAALAAPPMIPIGEPATLMIIGAGLACIAFYLQRRQQ
jgi:PEP-CTERM motif-containing protein